MLILNELLIGPKERGDSMPSGNTNIFKEYINRFEDLKANFNSEFRIYSDEESIKKFSERCDGRYGLEQEIESNSGKIKECTDYIHDLETTKH